jgi:hypothetical protein
MDGTPSLFSFDVIVRDHHMGLVNYQNTIKFTQTLGHKYYTERNAMYSLWRNVDRLIIIHFLQSLYVPQCIQFANHPQRLINLIQEARNSQINVAKIETDHRIPEKFVVDHNICYKVCSLTNPSAPLSNDLFADVRTETIKNSKGEITGTRVSDGPCLSWFDYVKDPTTGAPNYELPLTQRKEGAPLLLILHLFKAIDPETNQKLNDDIHCAISASIPKNSSLSPTMGPPPSTQVYQQQQILPPRQQLSNANSYTPQISPPKNSQLPVVSPQRGYQNLLRKYETEQLQLMAKNRNK